MAAPDSQLYLAQMLDNIERRRLWTSGHTLETYRANLMLRDAVEAMRSAVQSMIDES